jgi:NitT/TauT family transport system permease protein
MSVTPATSPAAAPAENDRFRVDQTVARQVRRRRVAVYATQAAVFVFIFGGWQLCTQFGLVDQFFFGQPSKIISQGADWFAHGTPYGSLWAQIGVTLEETVLGFVVGVVLGVIFGIALGRIRFLADVLGPYIKIVNSIPRIVLGAIFTVAFGLGLESKVLLAVVLVFFSVFFNAFQGAREVDRNLISNARILGASGGQVTRQVVLPSAFTWILASMHVSFGFALIGAIVGEYMGAQQGLGLLIAQSQNTFNPNGVFAAMFIIAILALVAEGLITLLERRLLAWRPPVLSGDTAGL